LSSHGIKGWSPRRFARLRRRAGLSQADLARAVGVSATTISSWERGRNAPVSSRLLVIAAALGVEVTEVAPLSARPDLRELRERAGLTQAALAELLHCSSGSISLIERTARWWPTTAETWAAALHVSLDQWGAAWEQHQR
jgi:transcriptional regulator with XRE-family HTH domain